MVTRGFVCDGVAEGSLVEVIARYGGVAVASNLSDLLPANSEMVRDPLLRPSQLPQHQRQDADSASVDLAETSKFSESTDVFRCGRCQLLPRLRVQPEACQLTSNLAVHRPQCDPLAPPTRIGVDDDPENLSLIHCFGEQLNRIPVAVPIEPAGMT